MFERNQMQPLCFIRAKQASSVRLITLDHRRHWKQASNAIETDTDKTNLPTYTFDKIYTFQ